MTNICRFTLPILIFISTNAFAIESGASSLFSRWSNEFSSSSVNQDLTAPLLWGIAWNGLVPRVENEDQLFSLASVKKVITAATSLRELGASFKFSNEFNGDLDVSQGVLFSPNFAVSGDPTWAHPSYGESYTTRLSKVIAALKKNKIKKVVGDIRIDLLRPAVGQFHRPTEWKNSWLLQCYAALPTPVTLSGNCAEMAINSANNIEWNTPGVDTPIQNKLIAATENSISIKPELDSLGRVEKYVVSGGFASAITEAVPVHNNEGWLKNLFIQQLRSAGISYSKTTNLIRSQSSTTLYVDLSSKTLKEILVPFLQESINLVGDRLHIEAPGDFFTLASLIPDSAEYKDVTLLDGSGLIAGNKMSPKTFLHFLTAIQSEAYFSDLYAALPVSGVSGTLTNRMDDALLKNRIHAKTGTIDGVANLAGYWLKSDQSLEPFVIFTDSNLPASTVRVKADALVAEFARKN